MQSRTALLGSAALAMIIVTSFAGATNAATTTKHKHHARAAAPADATAAEVKALSEEVETLESRLTAEGQAREALQGQVQAAQAQAAQAQADAQEAHAQLATQIQTIPGVVNSAVAAVKPKPSWADNTQVHATVFTDLSNIDQTPNIAGHPATKDGTGFDIKRAYLAVDHKFSDIYSADLTVDLAPQDASTTVGGAAVNQGEEVIKYAYVQANYAKELVIQVGAEKTPWVPFVEDLYGYRYIDKVVTDQNKFANSSDWGVNAHGAFFGDLLEYSVSAEDGQGYKTPDRSKTMDFEGRVNVNWNGFVAAIGGYDGKLGEDLQAVPTLPVVRTATREDALVGYSNSQIRFGAEWFQTKNDLTGGSLITSAHPDKSDGYSIFGSFMFIPQWAVFGRYDSLDPSKSLDPAERYTYYNVGLSYEPVKVLDIALVYKRETIAHALAGGYTDATTTLAPAGGSGTFSEVGLYTQFKF
jgi:hypothetical protein